MRKFEATWQPTQEDFDVFAKISGDDNPIHVDPVFSANSKFGRTVSHGMLIYTKLWGLLKRNIPDAVQTYQEVMFPAPTYAGDDIDLSITEASQNKFDVQATRRSNGENVLVGKLEIQ